MRSKLIAIAAIVMAPALAYAQAGGGGYGGGNAGGQGGGQGAQGATGGVATSTDTGTAVRSDTSMRRDTTSNKPTARTDTSMRRDTSTVQSSAAGELARPHRGRAHNMGLSSDEVKQLQQALNNAGCSAGPVDGQLGPETRQGVQCVRQQKNITEKGLNPVLQALNLNFTVSPSSSSDSSSMGGGHRRMHPDTTGAASQQYPSPKKAQHGRGMHDSSAAKTGADTSHEQ